MIGSALSDSAFLTTSTSSAGLSPESKLRAALAAKVTETVNLNSPAASYSLATKQAQGTATPPAAFVQGPSAPPDESMFGLPRIAVVGGAAVVGLGLVGAIVYKLKKRKKR